MQNKNSTVYNKQQTFNKVKVPQELYWEKCMYTTVIQKQQRKEKKKLSKNKTDK